MWGTHLHQFTQLPFWGLGTVPSDPSGFTGEGTRPEQRPQSGVYCQEALGTHWHHPTQLPLLPLCGTKGPASSCPKQPWQPREWFHEAVGTH